MGEHDFCTAEKCLKLEQQALADARNKGVRIPHIFAIKASGIGEFYQVFAVIDRGLAWEGQACCAWYARAQAIMQLVDDATGAS